MLPSPIPLVFPIPPSISGLLCTGGPIVAEDGGVTSMGSAVGDSDEVAEVGRTVRGRGLGPTLGPLENGLRGVDSIIELILAIASHW